MSVVRCVHCTNGRCGCFNCATAAHGAHYANQREMNCAMHRSFEAGKAKAKLPNDLAHKVAEAVVRTMLPRLGAGARQIDETYGCSICGGSAYLHFGGRR